MRHSVSEHLVTEGEEELEQVCHQNRILGDVGQRHSLREPKCCHRYERYGQENPACIISQRSRRHLQVREHVTLEELDNIHVRIRLDHPPTLPRMTEFTAIKMPRQREVRAHLCLRLDCERDKEVDSLVLRLPRTQKTSVQAQVINFWRVFALACQSERARRASHCARHIWAVISSKCTHIELTSSHVTPRRVSATPPSKSRCMYLQRKKRHVRIWRLPDASCWISLHERCLFRNRM